MDFFEAQARAKKRTSRLVVLFILAVLGTLLATYAAALVIQRVTGDGRPRRHSSQFVRTAAPVWQPQLFAGRLTLHLTASGISGPRRRAGHLRAD